MTPERWQAIEELYHSASEVPDEERHSFLHKVCDGDQSLVQEVESLLRHGSSPQSLLDGPAIALMAKALAVDEFQSGAPLFEGKTISHYRILEPIGRGGMGVVYKAEDLKLQRYVALKLLPQFLATDPQAQQRFEREAQAASALNHPHICTVYEIGEAEGLHFIAIELLDGETLKRRIARGPLDIAQILGTATEICDALEAAHSATIIHRDIKPSNIFITRRGSAKLLDFGVAKRAGPEPVRKTENVLSLLSTNVELRLTSPGAAIGTVAYMSPEQARGEDVDARSDIYSMGAVLYEMTTGKCAFTGKDAAEVLDAIQHRAPDPITKVNIRAPSELVRITNRAMEKDRSQRHQSASEMRADLQALRRGLETKASQRRSALVLALVVALFAMAAYGSLRVPRVREWVAGGWSSNAGREIKSLAVLPLENLTGDSSQDYFADGITNALITNLTKVGSIRVTSRTSAMQYKGSHKPLREIARELNVDAVLEGSVGHSGNRVLVSAVLVDAASDRNLWAQHYDRDLHDILQLQNELATTVALEVAGRLTPGEKSRLATKTLHVSPQAYEAYLKGEYFLNKWTAESLEKARVYFQQAINNDPSYAQGYAGLAEYYGTVAFLGVVPPREAWLKAESLLTKTLEMDPSSSKAHTLLGMLKLQFRCDRLGAEKELNRALELNPGDMGALDYHSYYLLEIGRTDEAIDEKKRVLEHDPLAVITSSELGGVYYLKAGRNDEAIAQLQKALELDANFAATHMRLGFAYENKQQYGQAVTAFEKAISLDKQPSRFFSLGEVYARWGKKREALETIRELQEMSKNGYVAPTGIALIYARLGQNRAAIAWLQKAKPDDQPRITDPGFDSLRPDPEFKALEARLAPDPNCPAL
jgi:eukaryotic-like serine/threonine-protein kinase